MDSSYGTMATVMSISDTNEIDLDLIPLSALRTKCIRLLSISLNPTKYLLSEDGLPRDWRGVMHCSGLSSQYCAHLSSKNDPMAELVRLLITEEPSKCSTIGQLQHIFEIIDRCDIVDDAKEMFDEDATLYVRNLSKRVNLPNAQLKRQNELMMLDANLQPDSLEANNVLTMDDLSLSKYGLPLQQYDAFILFADDDINFASEIIEKMEGSGLKLCARERDLVGGIHEHEAILQLITNRCTRLIVVVSPAFLESSANTFFVNYAQALGIEQRRRKIIPCLYKHCQLPPTLSYFFLLNYERSQSGRLWNFWDKLRESILKTPQESGNIPMKTLPRITITNVTESTEVTEEVSEAHQKSESATPISRDKKLRTTETRKNDECVSGKFANVTTSVDSNDSPKLRNKFWPPSPKLRGSTSSLVSLNALSSRKSSPSNELTLDSCFSGRKLSKSLEIMLNRSDGATSPNIQIETPKKGKWYNKIISSPSKLTESDRGLKTKDKGKIKKWLREKITGY